MAPRRSTRGMAVPNAQNQFTVGEKTADDERYSPIAVSPQLIGKTPSKIDFKIDQDVPRSTAHLTPVGLETLCGFHIGVPGQTSLA